MITPLLRQAFEPVFQRRRHLQRWWSIGWYLLAAAGLYPLIVVLGMARVPAALLTFLLLRITSWIISSVRKKHEEAEYAAMARKIEETNPQLHALLVTAIEQRPDPTTRKFSFLQNRVIDDAVAASRKMNWLKAVPEGHLWGARFFSVASAAVLMVVLFSLSARPHSPLKNPLAALTSEPVTIKPGDTSVERGSGLIVLADFHRDVPGAATLVVESKNQPEQRIPLVKNLNDPVFGGGLPEVDSELIYRIEYSGQVTRNFSVKVFEHPRLDRADATLHFPEYTKLPEKKVADTRRISAVEGSKLDVAFQLNKPVKSATLVAKDGTKIPLTVNAEEATVGLKEFPVKASQTYELKLEDADGRANKMPAQFAIEALPNRRPELKFQTPKGDQRVSPLEEVAFRADAWDDFGLVRYGLTMNIAGQGEKSLELGKESVAEEKREVAHLMKLEELGLKPDELISWFLWAEDIGPDGQPRRTATDMYFAEVRPFEEIFRPGQGSEGGGGGEAGNPATKLAELQKQIINATWKLQRDEEANITTTKPAAQYLKDALVVRDSQAAAVEQAQALAEKLESPQSKALAGEAVKTMQTAHEHLAKAEKVTTPLPDALSAEQAAYNALLKLAAHEFRVTKNKGKGQGQSQQQQQLDELEMKDEAKRYETKNEAEAPEKQQQREQLAILNRLKELAQRQQDINERVKELQTALQAAQTEKEKEEIRRQLKRLREEEQQMLADMDELRQSVEKSSQQTQLAEQKKQLETTREQAQKAAESMEKGEASQALASGTRAQQQLQEMRDELRKQTSGQFHQEMRDLRVEARELAKNQEAIAEKLQPEAGKAERKTLDGSGEREQLAKQFDKQRGDLGQITEKMKGLSEQAEAAEPLLAKELYDTLRKATQAGTDETLEKTQLLAERGYAPQARKFEEKARQDIDELKTGVERAAESVLGDEAEALRKARAELDTLKQQLESEIARNRPDLADNQKGQSTAADGKSPDGQDPKGQSPGQPGEGNSGDQSKMTANANAAGQDAKEGAQNGRGENGQAPKEGEQPGKAPEQSGKEGQTAQGQQPGGKDGQQPGGKEGQMAPGQQPGENGQGGKGQTAQGQQPGENGQGGKGQTAQGQQPGENGQGGKGQTAQGQQPGENGQGGKGQTAQGQQPGENGQGGKGQTAQGQQPGENGQGGKGQTAQGQQRGENGQGGKGQTAQGQQPGKGEGQGQGQGQQPGQGEGQGGGQGKGQTAQNSAQQNQGRGQGGNGNSQNASDDSQSADGKQRGNRLAQLSGGPKQRGGIRSGSDGGGGMSGGGMEGEEGGGPLTGEKFTEWSDRLRNVEEMVDDPALRTEVARIREFAKGVRVEFKRHSVDPNWDLVKSKIGMPLAELRDRLTEELARRESKENLVPIDRDPVPQKYAERVRRYYEELGRSR